MRKIDYLFLASGYLMLLASLRTCSAFGAELECSTDEPRMYVFDIRDQKTGRFVVKIDHTSGKLKGVTHKFVIRDVAFPTASEDFLTKSYSQGTPYSMTYALYCKIIKN